MRRTLILLLLVLATSFLLFLMMQKEVLSPSEPAQETAEEVSNSNNEKPSSIPIQELKLENFSDNELKNLYNRLNFANAAPIIEPPEITGNKQLDQQIAAIAKNRGYQLREVPKSKLIEHETHLMQPSLLSNWLKLQDKANAEGIDIRIRSAYRSVEEQRQIFIESLANYGVNPQSSAPVSTDTLNNIMALVAPPGYSRHHNGYTIDVYSPGYNVFEYSPAYQWLVQNNYENAKEYGFIPSYPKNAQNQGPNPEAWEYVWSDRYNLTKQ